MIYMQLMRFLHNNIIVHLYRGCSFCSGCTSEHCVLALAVGTACVQASDIMRPLKEEESKL